MDLLDRLLGHDAWTTRQLLDVSRGLSDEQLDQEFDVGLRTLRRTFVHIVRNMEVWTDIMAGRGPRPGGAANIAGLLARLDSAASDLARFATPIARDGRLDELWVDRLDDPPREKTYGGAIAHVVTHSMHHRCQAIHMLRRLGVEGVVEGDVLSWENRARPNRS